MTPQPGVLWETLFWTAVVGSVTSAIFCGLALAAVLRFRRRKAIARRSPIAFTPPISVLKPLHGTEPGLRESIESFFKQQYPAPYEILFCARHDDDAGLQIAREVASLYPDQPVRFIACGEPEYPNPKMYSLAVMTEAARYPHLVTSDADARVRPDYLARCVQSLAPGHTSAGQQVELASCLYTGCVDRGGLFTHLDAAGKSVEMGSGVLVADMLSGTDFALGVTMVLQKHTFYDAGGCADLGGYWAEDFVLGNRLAATGRGVEMSTHVIQLIVADQGAVRSFRDQLRWMQSTRRSRPWGHLGTGLTFAMPFGLLGFAGGSCAWRMGWGTGVPCRCSLQPAAAGCGVAARAAFVSGPAAHGAVPVAGSAGLRHLVLQLPARRYALPRHTFPHHA